MAKPRIPPPNVPMIDNRGMCSPAWYRWFADQEKQTTDAAAGEILAGDGLTGGGVVADGVELAVASGGVSNAMIREGLGTSVIGRDVTTTGEVADIVATDDGQVLCREGGIVAFRKIVTVEALTLDLLLFSDAPTASAATPSTHKIEVRAGGSTYYLLATT